MIFPFLIIFTLYLVNRAAQSSLQSLLIEMREPVERPGRTWPVEALVDRSEESGTWTEWCAFMMEPLAAATLGPKGVATGLEH